MTTANLRANVSVMEITQTRSSIGAQESQRRTLRALGLRKPNQTVSRPDSPQVRGMIAKVAHLVEVRYRGADEVVGVQPGQEPKGVGNPPAGTSVDDDEVADLREAEEQATGFGSDVHAEDLVQNPPNLEAPDQPDTPKARRGAGADEAAPESDREPPPEQQVEEEIE